MNINFHKVIKNWGVPALALVLFFLVWEGVVVVFRIPRFVLPAPSMVFLSLWQWGQIIAWHSGQTMYTTILGFGAAVLVGLLLGWAVGFSALLYKALYPLLIAFNSIPKVAIVPILVIWFGIGTIPAILTAFLISFFPIMVNVATGLATLEPELRDVLRSLGAAPFQIFRKVGLPRTLPYFFGSLKVAVTMAFVGSVISETVASNRGIGYLMIAASSRFDVPLVFAGLLAIAIMGVALYLVAAVLEARLTKWAYHR
ncbi:MAG: ABC transporter permease [Candidatus Bipolaricaulaceae bacterium]